MKAIFVSQFAERLSTFIDQKRALGYAYTNVSDPKMFDRMCAEQFSGETALTAEICNAWSIKRGNETAKTSCGWSAFIREFAVYLIRSGEHAYILPKGTEKCGQKYIPHIYSRSELAEMWRAFDDVQPTGAYPAAHLVLPTLIRFLYCCGMRPGEALKLRAKDVNLCSGKIFIAESKGNRDRIVMLADDAIEMCRNYDRQISGYFPNRKFFFAKNSGDACDYRWPSKIFRELRKTLHFDIRGGNLPRIYDLRHTFATHRLYQWMRDGKDLYAMLPYLSSYMGHANLTETLYYIHLVPGMLESMSGFSYASAADIYPKVVVLDE